MDKLKRYSGYIVEFFQSRHIQVALVAGFWLIAMSYVSKRVLPEPMRKLWLSLPPLMFTFYEYALLKKKYSSVHRTLYWLIAFSAVNMLIIAIHLYRAGII